MSAILHTVLLSFSLTSLAQLHATEIVIHQVDFKNNDEYIKVFITIRNGTGLQRGTVVDIDALVYQNISDGLQVRMELASKVGADYHTLFGSDVNMCRLNGSSSDDPLMGMMISEMNKYGNMSIECPFNTGNYVVRNFRLDTDNTLIKLAPPGDYRVGVDVKLKDDERAVAIPMFDIELYATIIGDFN